MSTTARKGLALLLGVGTALSTTACGELGTSAQRTTEVSLSFAVPRAPSAALVPVSDHLGRTLDIQQVQLLLREAELKRATRDQCVEEDDACERFVVGPLLVDLPVEGGVVTPFAEAIPADTYDQLRVRIKEPEDDDGARARFQAEHPDWPRKATVRVRGTFDAGDGRGARPFDLFIEADERIERELSPPLVVEADTDPAAVNVTLSVALADWFRTADGRLLDPGMVAEDDDLADLVEENLERSFEAFLDDDRDGRRGGRG